MKHAAGSMFRDTRGEAEQFRIISEQMSQVRFIARRIHHRLPRNVALEDLVHAGIIGLIDALQKFDSAKRVQLKSYAKFRIRGAILDSLRELDWGPRDLRRKARQMDDLEGNLRARHGRTPTESEMAAGMAMSLADFHRFLGDLRGLDVSSLQTTADTEGEHPRGETSVCDPGLNPFELYLREETCAKLALAVSELGPRERQILALYYHEEKTMREIGSLLGIGESRVSQVHSAAMVRLRSRVGELLAVDEVAKAS